MMFECSVGGCGSVRSEAYDIVLGGGGGVVGRWVLNINFRYILLHVPYWSPQVRTRSRQCGEQYCLHVICCDPPFTPP